MAFPAYLDTCVLFPSYLRDTLLRLAEVGIYRPLWSADVLDELGRNLIEYGIAEWAVDRCIAQMKTSFPDAEVRGYRDLIDSMTCHKKDRHVLAAAVRANAEVIVTFNLHDFPADALDRYDVVALHPDAFLLDQLDLSPAATMATLMQQVGDYDRPPMAVNDLLVSLGRAGAPQFASEARRHLH